MLSSAADPMVPSTTSGSDTIASAAALSPTAMALIAEVRQDTKIKIDHEQVLDIWKLPPSTRMLAEYPKCTGKKTVVPSTNPLVTAGHLPSEVSGPSSDVLETAVATSPNQIDSSTSGPTRGHTPEAASPAAATTTTNKAAFATAASPSVPLSSAGTYTVAPAIPGLQQSIIWIEKPAFLRLQKKHLSDFAAQDIGKDDIIPLIKAATLANQEVHMQRTRPVFEVEFKGATRRVAIQIGNNVYVVGANPSSRTEVLTAEVGDENVHVVLMPDYGCWPLWVLHRDGLANLNPTEYITDTKLATDVTEWADKVTADVVNIPLRQKNSPEDIHSDLHGISLASRLKEYFQHKARKAGRLTYVVNFHSIVLGQRSSDLQGIKSQLQARLEALAEQAQDVTN